VVFAVAESEAGEVALELVMVIQVVEHHHNVVTVEIVFRQDAEQGREQAAALLKRVGQSGDDQLDQLID